MQNNWANFEVSCRGKVYHIQGERVKDEHGCWNCSFPYMTPELIAKCIPKIFKGNEEVEIVKFSFFKASYQVKRKRFFNTRKSVLKCIKEQKKQLAV